MIEYTVKVGKNKTEWFHNGQLHREDGPALEYASGDKCWFLDGRLHRQDGPALEYADGVKFWYLNEKEVTEDEVMKPVKKLTVAEIEAKLGYKIQIVA
jgi:hypothetical protein